MHIPAALQRDLRALTDALDRPDADLAASLAELVASARLAVGSYLGLSLLVGSEIGLSVFGDTADPSHASTSLFLGLSPTGGAKEESTVLGVVLYAGVPGAFVDLAADAGWLGVGGEVRLDQHLPAPTDPTSSTYLADQSTINQAIGVLVGGGATLEEARARLDEHARSGRVTRVAAASRILDELEGSPPQAG